MYQAETSQISGEKSGGKAVIQGKAPEFVKGELLTRGIDVCTGEAFLKSIYPKLISRMAKLNSDCRECTVYDDMADEFTVEVVLCASSYFKQVSLYTPCSCDHIADKVMDMTGMALKLGHGKGVKILCRGNGCNGAELDLTTKSQATFYHENNRIISPSLAEAIADNNLDGDVLKRLKLKIHSLC